MKRVMIDIETMDTHTSESLLLSVGAVAFGLETAGVTFYQDSFLKVLTIPEQLAAGRRVGRDTQMWWAKQSPAARAHWLNQQLEARVTPAQLHAALNAWLINSVGFDDTWEVWSNGIVFDIGNLDNLFLSLGLPLLWPYNRVRDYRTVRDVFPILRTLAPDLEPSNAHDPIWDCKNQVRTLWTRMPESEMDDYKAATASVANAA